MVKISDVQTAYYRIPLPEIMEDAKTRPTHPL